MYMYTYISEWFISFICYLELLCGFLFDNHWKCFCYHSVVEEADEAFASKTSTATTTGEPGILNCNPTSFFLSYKCRHCYINHCFLASINDWVNKLDGAYANVGNL